MKKLKEFKIVERRKLWFALPFVLILGAIIAFASYAGFYKDFSKGINIGIDFSGGSVATVILGEDKIGNDAGFKSELGKIEDVITDKGIAEQVAEYAKGLGIDINASNAVPSVSYTQKSDTGEAMAIVIKYDNVSKTFDNAGNEVTSYRNGLIENKLKELYSIDAGYASDTVTLTYIGATASSALIKTAVLAVCITLALILIYIIIRFEIWSGVSAIVGLLHDVIIMVSLTIIFHIQINSAFIAAMITIVSYSINNTIVVFDRLRENVKIDKGLKQHTSDNRLIVDESIRETALRSINSTVTTMFAIAIFAILGAASVREFALPVIFGLIAGFYSSMFVAPSLYYVMKDASDKRKAKKLASGGKSQFAGVKKKA